MARLSALNPNVRLTVEVRSVASVTADVLVPFDVVYLAASPVSEQV